MAAVKVPEHPALAARGASALLLATAFSLLSGCAGTTANGPADAIQVTAAASQPASEGIISVECRFLSVPAGEFPKIRRLLPKDVDTATVASDQDKYRIGAQPALLDANQLGRLLKAVARSRRCTILSAPRVSLRNAQDASVEIHTSTSYVVNIKKVTDSAGQILYEAQVDTVPTGCGYKIRTTLAPDHRRIEIDFDSWSKRLLDLDSVPYKDAPADRQLFIQRPVTEHCEFAGSASVPSGHTLVLLSGQRPEDPRQPDGPKFRYIQLLTPRITPVAGSTNRGPHPAG